MAAAQLYAAQQLLTLIVTDAVKKARDSAAAHERDIRLLSSQ
eukprot:CAMPEP_0185841268 /NCGR_PEP_ID=MMETSP1353-20130828/17608_1 /TAXON_ID=1077150 /ORGANISM="Erythrolobus australicus, Strain CCMP3124" /LENGTH=41 /DNA_ID= /DNA_START= /DNA_END= /DNA_ORIENTATION=